MDPVSLEQNNRTICFFGAQDFEKIRNSFVVVVGLGGVGSHTAIMLARSGVERLRFVDFDVVTQSSLNRHACATRRDVGRTKAEVLAEYAKEVAPNAIIEACNILLCAKSFPLILSGQPDYVVDNIDNRETKCGLIEYCVRNSIRLVSSMGAGGQADPTRVRIGNIDEARGPLSKEIRRRLRKFAITPLLKAVYSTEAPRARLIAPSAAAPQILRDADNDQHFFRAGIMPVAGFMPAIFGNACVSIVLNDIVGRPLKPELPNSNREALYHRVLKRLENKHWIAPPDEHNDLHTSTTPHPSPPPTDSSAAPATTAHVSSNLAVIDVVDVQYMIEDLWRGHSPVSGDRTHVSLTVWDKSKPFGADNCIALCSGAELRRHEAAARLADIYSADFIARVQQRLTTAVAYQTRSAYPQLS